MTGVGNLSFENPVFRAFAAYATIVVVKTMLMSVTTAFHRITKKAFANPEDTVAFRDREGGRLKPVTNEAVERVRRCHLNDLENVIPFVLIGLLYVTSSPNLSSAVLHFRLFTGARLFHTMAYLLPLPQPARGLGFFIGYFTTFSMAYSVISKAGFSL